MENPSRSEAMPGLLEFAFPLLQPGDQLVEWATAVHRWRGALSHFDYETVLPLPLHLAKLMEEYLPSYKTGE